MCTMLLDARMEAASLECLWFKCSSYTWIFHLNNVNNSNVIPNLKYEIIKCISNKINKWMTDNKCSKISQEEDVTVNRWWTWHKQIAKILIIKYTASKKTDRNKNERA